LPPPLHELVTLVTVFVHQKFVCAEAVTERRINRLAQTTKLLPK
jgi:hypothetical protein